jgi:hypothetical protein
MCEWLAQSKTWAPVEVDEPPTDVLWTERSASAAARADGRLAELN